MLRHGVDGGEVRFSLLEEAPGYFTFFGFFSSPLHRCCVQNSEAECWEPNWLNAAPLELKRECCGLFAADERTRNHQRRWAALLVAGETLRGTQNCVSQLK